MIDAQIALEKLTNESVWTEAELRAEMIAVVVLFETENACVESLNCELVTEVDKK